MPRNSLNDLLAQKAALDKKISDMQRASRSDAVAKVKSLMAEYGLTAADIGGNASANGSNINSNSNNADNSNGGAQRGGKRSGGGVNPASPFKPKRTSANAGKKVAPKYRNPATGETWSGRGLKPKWLAAALSSGRSISEFSL